MNFTKEVAGYEGRYSVSINGELISHIGKKDKILAINNVEVYKRQVMCDRYGNRKTHSIHRLVAEAFIENIYNKPCVNHIDGNKHNNSASNLEWVTQQENLQHAVDNGLMVSTFGKLYKSNMSTREHGISKYKNGGFTVRIQVNKKRYYIGYYKDINNAIKNRDLAIEHYTKKS